MNAPSVELSTSPSSDLVLRQDLRDLAKIAVEALAFLPPLYVESILGPAYTWFYPPRADSEFRVLDIWRPLQTAGYLRDIIVPSVPWRVPRALSWLPPVVINSFWRTSGYFQQNDPFDSDNSFSNERWFYVNGICTNHDVAQINSNYLSRMFGRPITVVHSTTNSVLIDLYQCALGKGVKTNPDIHNPQTMTEPSVKATIAILNALSAQEVNRVVVLCHSQGTITVANVIKAISNIVSECDCSENPDKLVERLSRRIIGEDANNLEHATVNELKREIMEFARLGSATLPTDSATRKRHIHDIVAKFEVYAFANCATKMEYIFERPGEDPFPYIESFANSMDLVARLGVISPENKPEGLVTIDGPAYVNTRPWWKIYSAWGHLLNQNYLFGMSDYLSKSVKETNAINPYQLASKGNYSETPRLYRYFNGKSPEPLVRK